MATFMEEQQGFKLKITVHISKRQFLDPEKQQTCSLFGTLWDTHWIDWRCYAPIQSGNIQCACESKETTFLTMRGLCPISLIDIYYEPFNIGEGFIYRGWDTTNISFKKERKEWVLNVGYRPLKTGAFSDSSYHSFLLGKSNWIVENDGMINI